MDAKTSLEAFPVMQAAPRSGLALGRGSAGGRGGRARTL